MTRPGSSSCRSAVRGCPSARPRASCREKGAPRGGAVGLCHAARARRAGRARPGHVRTPGRWGQPPAAGHRGTVSSSCGLLLREEQHGSEREDIFRGRCASGRLRAAAAHPPRPGVQLTASTAADGAGWGWAARPALPLFGSASGERLLPARSRAAGLLAGARAAALLRCRPWASVRWSPCMQPLSAANPRPSRARARLTRWALR